MKTGCLLLLVCIVTMGVFGQNRFHLLYWALPPIVLLAFQAESPPCWLACCCA